MAESGDRIIYEARLDQTDAGIRQMAADLQEQAKEMRSVGQAAVAEVKEAQAQLYLGMLASPEKVSAGTAALEKQRDTMAEIQRIELFTLDELERGNAAYEQRAAVLDRIESKQRAYAGQQQVLFGPEPAPMRERLLGQKPLVEPTLTPAWRQALDDERQAEERINAERQRRIGLNQRLAQQQAYQAESANWMARGERIGGAAASRGYLVPESARQTLIGGPAQNPMWGVAQQQQMRLNIATGEYNVLARQESIGLQALSTNFTRLGMVEAESSNALRRHGALTTEYLQSLARGETTVSEFGYQIGATIGKFAGWAGAAALVYGAFGAVTEFAHGATDASSAAQQLQRTITGVNPDAAVKAINGLSTETNVSVKEAGDAIFQYSRVFHNLGDATAAAHQGLAVLKLDNVSLADSVALSTGIHQQWGKTAEGLLPIWNMLAAGQREYNARISQTTTILRGAQAAVRGAGGDLNQLTQLAVLGAQALPGQPGQIATALRRSATTYARQNLGQIQARFGIGRGMTEESYNFTQLFEEAIRRAPKLSERDRRRMGTLFFDPRLAASVGSAYFTRQAAATLGQEQGGPRAITPAGTEGALSEELGRQMATFHERMQSVSNEIQRAGATFGASGIINMFSGLISAGVHVSSSLRTVIDTFDTMPNTLKEVVEGLIAARLGFMALTRTRFGASLLDAAGLADSRLSGRARGTLDRGELRVGTRAALDTVTNDLTRTNTRLLTNAEQMRVLKERQAVVDEEIAEVEGRGLKAQAELLEESNAFSMRIKAMMAEQTELEADRNAQERVQLDLKAQQLALGTANRSLRFTEPEVAALKRETQRGTSVALGGTSRDEVQARALEEKQRLAGLAASAEKATTAEAASIMSQIGAQTGWRAAQERMAGLMARLTGAQVAAAGAMAGATAATGAATAGEAGVAARVLGFTRATEAEIAAAGAGAAAQAGAAGATRGLVGRLGGLVAAIDPWLLALIALPEAIAVVSKAFDDQKKANQAVKDSYTQYYPGDPAAGLRDFAANLEKQTKRQRSAGIGGMARDVGSFVARTVVNQVIPGAGSWFDQLSPVRHSGRNPASDAARRLAPRLAQQERAFRTSAQDMNLTGPQLQRLGQAMDRVAGGEIAAALKGHPAKIAATTQAVNTWVQTTLNDIRQSRAHTQQTQFDFLTGLSDEGLQGWAKGYATKAGAYGLQGGDLRGAIEATMIMAARYRKSSDPKELQALQSSISTVTQEVGKNADSWIAAAKTAPSAGAADADLGKAQGGINRARQAVSATIEEAKKKWGKIPGVMAALNIIAQGISNQFNSFTSNILSQHLSQIQTQSDAAASQVPGFSPEADIRRAQIHMGGLEKQRQAALKGGDWQKAQDLQNQVNDAGRGIAQQQYDNAQGVADTNAQIAAARILPISPEAKLQAARILLARAKQKIAEDKANNVGAAKEAQDYLAMLNDEQGVRMAERDNADQLFDAYQALSVSQITGIGPAADLARARRVASNAQDKLRRDDRLHKGQIQHVLDYQAVLDDQRAVNQQMKSNVQTVASDAAALISAQASLQEAQTLDPVAQAREALAADLRILATIKPGAFATYRQYQAAFIQQQAKIAQDRRTITQQYVDTQMSTLQFELSTQQISEAQYVAGLQKLLRTARLTQQQRQQLQQEIFNATHAEAVNLNVANIKLPTSYEVRRAIRNAMRQAGTRIPQNTGTVVNHHVVNHVTMNIRVDKNADVRPFAQALDSTIKSNFTGQAQAAGLI